MDKFGNSLVIGASLGDIVTAEDARTNPERDQTDESLRVERERTDLAFTDDLAASDEAADEVIRRARARADDVLAAARAKTDEGTTLANVRISANVARQRAHEDDVMESERADADDTVRAERAETAALLAQEREETDKDLLSERVRSDDALATRDAFLEVVSHDLRNMLTSIMAAATLISRDVQQVDHDHVAPVVAHTQRIQRSSARMNRLIGDLVDVASIEAGMLAVVPEIGDPAQVVAEAVAALRAQALVEGVALVAEDAPVRALAVFDPARILQVLTNLLGNAIKFTPRNGKVVVRLERAGDDVRVDVSDTGPGIPADQLEAIFGRFVQVAKNDRRGVGLGLYISKSIVQGHGGRIWAASRLGEGSTFSFTLPVHVGSDAGAVR